MTRRRQFLLQACRNSFYPFLCKSFGILHPTSPFIPNWHLRALTHALETTELNGIKRLIISQPPRELKSIAASVAFPAWILGIDPSRKIICVSYSQDLAAKHARDFRRLVNHEDYHKMFPETVFGGGRNTEMEQETTRNGFRLATSVTGTLTGRGGNIIIIDDPIKPDEVLSEVERANVNDWYKRTLLSRLDNPNDDIIIIVTQRVHEDDLVGHVTADDDHDWTILNIPAIATEETEYRTGHRPNDIYVRQKDEVINPTRMSRATLEQRRAQVGSMTFAAQYQQEPVPLEGNLVKRQWLHYYDECLVLPEFDAVYQSWDTASEAAEINNYTVCTTWGIEAGHLYLLDVFRKKLEFPDLVVAAKRLALEYCANVVLIEGASSGHSLRQSLKSKLNARILKVTPKGDKAMRLYAVSHMFENRRVLLPKQAPWLAQFERELLGFPGLRDDDQVDSVTQFLKHIHGKRVGSPKYNSDGKRIRRQPERRSSNRTRLFVGQKSVPIDLFGSGRQNLL